MNRFQEQMEKAMQAINQMQDEHRFITHELAQVKAENKRLRFAQYGTYAPQNKAYRDALLGSDRHPVYGKELRTKVETYFDVLSWRWVAWFDVPGEKR